MSVDRLIKRSQQGKFPAYKEGKLWRVEKEELRKHIEKHRVMKEA